MNKLLYVLFCLVGCVAFTSCLDDDTDDYLEWKNANEAYFEQMRDSITPGTADHYYTELPAGSYKQFSILYREITEPTGTVSPNYTSTVKVNYAGYLYNATDAFESNNNVEGLVSSYIQGWQWALQNMKAGSTWEVIIPWQLAYGESGSGSIAPYSALRFTIELISIPKLEK